MIILYQERINHIRACFSLPSFSSIIKTCTIRVACPATEEESRISYSICVHTCTCTHVYIHVHVHVYTAMHTQMYIHIMQTFRQEQQKEKVKKMHTSKAGTCTLPTEPPRQIPGTVHNALPLSIDSTEWPSWLSCRCAKL